jgi:hypothetical protein
MVMRAFYFLKQRTWGRINRLQSQVNEKLSPLLFPIFVKRKNRVRNSYA